MRILSIIMNSNDFWGVKSGGIFLFSHIFTIKQVLYLFLRKMLFQDKSNPHISQKLIRFEPLKPVSSILINILLCFHFYVLCRYMSKIL